MSDLEEKVLEALEHYCAEGTAESEAAFLSAIFVAPTDFAHFSKLRAGTPRLLIGKKGSGKSVLVRKLVKQAHTEGRPALLLKPKDIGLQNGSSESLGDLTSLAESALIRAIAAKIGELASGFLDPELALLDSEAREQGGKRPDFVQRLREVLTPVAQLLGHSATSDSPTVSKSKFKQAINSLLDKKSKEVLLVIDDTDQIAKSGAKSDLDRIWALILACRSIQEDCPGVRSIVVLRSEVWRRLSVEDTAHRDQIDHFRNSVYTLSPDEKSIRQIFIHRMRTVIDHAGTFHKHPFQIIFAHDDVAIPSSTERRTWDDFVVGRSRKRPRDAVQMMALLAAQVRMRWSTDKSRINDGDVAAVMGVYSEQRVDDLQIEYGFEFPEIKNIVRKFAHSDYDEGAFTFSADRAMEFIQTLPSSGLILRGRSLAAGDRAGAFELWAVLFQAGFLNARITDIANPREFTHALEECDPTFVSQARWGEMQAALWEVNPAYRDYLLRVQADSPIGKGLPRKRRGLGSRY